MSTNDTGFFIQDYKGMAEAYIAHWKCCSCRYDNKIWDNNHAWNNQEREYCYGPTSFTTCPKVYCTHVRCGDCYDASPRGDPVRYCSGRAYRPRKAVALMAAGKEVANVVRSGDAGGAGVSGATHSSGAAGSTGETRDPAYDFHDGDIGDIGDINGGVSEVRDIGETGDADGANDIIDNGLNNPNNIVDDPILDGVA